MRKVAAAALTFSLLAVSFAVYSNPIQIAEGKEKIPMG
jgi:hypothetical protein